MRKNILTSLLNLLGVKHTSDFSSKLFDGHPHKNNLFGLSEMLDIYGIDNTVIKVESKNILFDLPVPFIAHTHDNFVLIKSFDNNAVNCVINNKILEIDADKFKSMWSGIVLLPKTNEYSKEPNYKQNYTKKIVDNLQRMTLVFLVSVFCIVGYLHNMIYENLYISLMVIISIVGIFVCTLLVRRQLRIGNGIADRICSIFKTGDCDEALTSPKSKLFGFFSLSIVGLSYFIGNTFLIIFFPDFLSYVIIINILSLPFTLWSIWVQSFKLNHWCPLCMIVIVNLWLFFICSLLSGNIFTSVLSPIHFAITCMCYITSFLFLSVILPKIEVANNYNKIESRFNYLRMQEDVFKIELTKERKFDVENTTSIIFGNPEAPHHLTIVTNPHCNPCALLHNRIEKLLPIVGDKISINYIFLSPSDTYKHSVIGLLWVYYHLPPEQCLEVYNKWFESEQKQPDIFFQQYNVDFTDNKSNHEYICHKNWVKKNMIANTPYVIYDGYKVNEIYDINDLPNFINVQLNNR